MCFTRKHILCFLSFRKAQLYFTRKQNCAKASRKEKQNKKNQNRKDIKNMKTREKTMIFGCAQHTTHDDGWTHGTRPRAGSPCAEVE